MKSVLAVTRGHWNATTKYCRYDFLLVVCNNFISISYGLQESFIIVHNYSFFIHLPFNVLAKMDSIFGVRKLESTTITQYNL